MAKRGRPSVYQESYATQAHELALLGLTDNQISGVLGITTATFYNWQKKYPDFLESINAGKELADAKVAKKLFERATGYEHPEDKIFQVDGEALIVPTTKHYPPDTQAASLWLRNRQSKKWRDKQDHEHTGADGGPIRVEWEIPDTKKPAE